MRIIAQNNIGMGKSICVELPPSRRIIKGFRGKTFYLPFPYMQFSAFISKRWGCYTLDVSVTPNPARRDRLVYHCGLPNVSGHNVCLGTSMDMRKLIANGADHKDLIGFFWDTRFDLVGWFGPKYDSYGPNPPMFNGEPLTLKNWESLEDEDFKKVKWMPSMTLDNFLPLSLRSK